MPKCGWVGEAGEDVEKKKPLYSARGTTGETEKDEKKRQSHYFKTVKIYYILISKFEPSFIFNFFLLFFASSLVISPKSYMPAIFSTMEAYQLTASQRVRYLRRKIDDTIDKDNISENVSIIVVN